MKNEITQFLQDENLCGLMSPSGEPSWYAITLFEEYKKKCNQKPAAQSAVTQAFAKKIKRKVEILQMKLTKEKKNLVVTKKAEVKQMKKKVVSAYSLLQYIKFRIRTQGSVSEVGLVNPNHWQGSSTNRDDVSKWLDDLSNPRNPKIAIDDDTSRITILD